MFSVTKSDGGVISVVNEKQKDEDQVEALKRTAEHLAALPKCDAATVHEMPQAAGGQ